ncbi:MAG: DNA recombination protein RmuC [Pontiellaceae bacterium]|nr:DNA recombination protein RmuC [Pontiellaceae bacterium]MBN2786153.1 DNA recombination protein RmuC [Pontiellaceae bacterium]
MLTTVLLILVALLLAVLIVLYLTGATRVNTRLDELGRRVDSMTEQGDTRIQRIEDIFRGLEKDLRTDVEGVRVKVDESLEKNARQLGERVKELIDTNERRLGEISGKVEERLDKGFEKTTTVFADVLKRLALIDKAQERIAELSGNVVSLQEVLSDKRSRGAFGEVQLSALISNMMPENSYSLQHTFDNGVRADCVLFLPEPTGTICIDSKFPLESYQRMTDTTLGDADRKTAEQQFRQDIKKHIKDISTKYIIPGETSDGAVMFIPAEAVFAEIHGHYPDLVEEAQRARVWLASPTTMMAVLTTSRAVLKDAATRKQVHIIQEHLVALSKDFERFQQRMDKLATHIGQANKDVGDVQISAKKITSRFTKIEKVELEGEEPDVLDEPAE